MSRAHARARKASSDLAESWQEEGMECKHLGLEHAKGYSGVAAACDDKRANRLDGKTAVLALEVASSPKCHHISQRSATGWMRWQRWLVAAASPAQPRSSPLRLRRLTTSTPGNGASPKTCRRWREQRDAVGRCRHCCCPAPRAY